MSLFELVKTDKFRKLAHIIAIEYSDKIQSLYTIRLANNTNSKRDVRYKMRGNKCLHKVF